MEYEVNVPFPVRQVHAALAERERVARCVPGLQLDVPGAGSVSGRDTTYEGRLRVRVGGASVTYRGSLTLSPHGDGLRVRGSGSEARGSGGVELVLDLVPRPVGDTDRTRLMCTGTVRGTGRFAEFETKAAAAAGARMLDRFGKALADSIAEDTPATAQASSGGIGEPDDNERAIPGIPKPENRDRAEQRDEPPAAAPRADEPQDDVTGEAPDDTVVGADVPEEEPGTSGPSQPSAPDEPAPGTPAPAAPDADAEPSAEPPAEAAHARRTMIGRSAEEVDHAPPRGRYAPAPAPGATTTTVALRWAAPAAALAVAGAVVIGRALRRR